MSEASVVAITVGVGAVMMSALLATLGFLIRMWIGGISADITALVKNGETLLNRVISIEGRLGHLEGWQQAQTGSGGRRWTDKPLTAPPD